MKPLFKSLKKHFSEEKARLKDMTWREKLDHIWSYYKEYMFIALMLVIIAAVAISAVMNSDLEYYACGVMSNVELTREGHAYLTDQFHDQYLSHLNGKTYLSRSELKGANTVSDTDDSYSATMGVLAQIEGKDLDYMLMDPYSFEHYVDERIYADLTQLLPPEDLQHLYDQGLIVQMRSDEETVGTPVGIDISQLPFGQDCLLTEGTVYLVFIRNADHPEHSRQLWEHIKNWAQEEN